MILLLALGIVTSGPFDSQKLVGRCMQRDRACLGYILGVIDADEFRLDPIPARPKLLCMPEAVQETELVEIVRRAIVTHPERNRMPAPTIVSRALMDVYACARR